MRKNQKTKKKPKARAKTKKKLKAKKPKKVALPYAPSGAMGYALGGPVV